MPSIITLGSVCLSLGLVGCTAYSPGSFRHRGQEFSGQLVTLECLDLAVAGDRDVVAPGPSLDYRFGNRCDHAIAVDLGAVLATGRTPSGEEVALVPYDPYREIKPLRLEARTAGRERLAYRGVAPGPPQDFGIDLVSVCVALDGVTGHSGGGRVCFDAGGRVAEVTP